VTLGGNGAAGALGLRPRPLLRQFSFRRQFVVTKDLLQPLYLGAPGDPLMWHPVLSLLLG
jgi:hypothetical protein